jgi:hypothetical protein
MNRYDGTELHLDAMKTLEPFVMKFRTASWVLCLQQYDLSKTLPFIEEYNRERNLDKTNRLTLFQVLLCAGARTIAYYPKLNRFIAGKRYYQRNRLNFSFVVKPDPTDPNSPESFTKFDLSPYETLDSIRENLHTFVKEARMDGGSEQEQKIQALAKLPHRVKVMVNNIIARRDYKGKLGGPFIESDPVFCSAVFANLGSVGVRGTLIHHMFEYGNASIFITLGTIKKGVVINENNEVEVRDVVDIAYNIDERISGGKYFALVLKMLQDLTENPEKLLIKPDLPEEKIKELNLVDLTKYKPYLRTRKKLK